MTVHAGPSLQPLGMPSPCGLGSHGLCNGVALHQQIQSLGSTAHHRGRQAVGEEVGARTLAQQVNQFLWAGCVATYRETKDCYFRTGPSRHNPRAMTRSKGYLLLSPAQGCKHICPSSLRQPGEVHTEIGFCCRKSNGQRSKKCD